LDLDSVENTGTIPASAAMDATRCSWTGSLLLCATKSCASVVLELLPGSAMSDDLLHFYNVDIIYMKTFIREVCDHYI